jgi:hypothetical protein
MGNGFYTSVHPRSRSTHAVVNSEQILTSVNQRLKVNDQLLTSLKTSNDALETLDLILAFKANIKRSLKELDQLPIRSGGRGVMPTMIENKDYEREINHFPRLIPKNPRKSLQQPPFPINAGQPGGPPPNVSLPTRGLAVVGPRGHPSTVTPPVYAQPVYPHLQSNGQMHSNGYPHP